VTSWSPRYGVRYAPLLTPGPLPERQTDGNRSINAKTRTRRSNKEAAARSCNAHEIDPPELLDGGRAGGRCDAIDAMRCDDALDRFVSIRFLQLQLQLQLRHDSLLSFSTGPFYFVRRASSVMTDRRPTRLDSTRWVKHSGRGQAGRADLAGFISASPSPSIHAACLKHPILFSRLVAFPLLVDCCLLRAVVWKSAGSVWHG
jgi:hypothetical protein